MKTSGLSVEVVAENKELMKKDKSLVKTFKAIRRIDDLMVERAEKDENGDLYDSEATRIDEFICGIVVEMGYEYEDYVTFFEGGVV